MVSKKRVILCIILLIPPPAGKPAHPVQYFSLKYGNNDNQNAFGNVKSCKNQSSDIYGVKEDLDMGFYYWDECYYTSNNLVIFWARPVLYDALNPIIVVNRFQGTEEEKEEASEAFSSFSCGSEFNQSDLQVERKNLGKIWGQSPRLARFAIDRINAHQ